MTTTPFFTNAHHFRVDHQTIIHANNVTLNTTSGIAEVGNVVGEEGTFIEERCQGKNRVSDTSVVDRSLLLREKRHDDPSVQIVQQTERTQSLESTLLRRKRQNQQRETLIFAFNSVSPFAGRGRGAFGFFFFDPGSPLNTTGFSCCVY
jgi:hypothetical protein